MPIQPLGWSSQICSGRQPDRENQPAAGAPHGARRLAGRSIGVSQAPPDGQSLAGCHIAYVAGMTASQAAKVVAGLRDAPVLTISEVEGFTKMGGIAQFFFENGQLRFDVQVASAKRARLQISSRLLVLARTTK